MKVDDYYDKDSMPIKCWKCCCDELNEVGKDYINGIQSEVSFVCVKCETEVGYWAYGYFNPDYKMDLIKQLADNSEEGEE